MDVAILYSGGKDSTFAIAHALEKKWNIKYLLSVKPSIKDCYLFHFATVEHTKQLAEILGIRHIYAACNIADAKKEAEIVRKIVEKNPVDAVVLGGIGLQETQIRAIKEALAELGVDAFAAHAGKSHKEIMQDMMQKGYEIVITQIAANGLTEEWLGRKLTKENFHEFCVLSEKYGFHVGGEGGHFDTLVTDGPIFNKKLEIVSSKAVMDYECKGHLQIDKTALKEKLPAC